MYPVICMYHVQCQAQGEQIGRIFTQRVIVYFGQIFYITKFWATFSMTKDRR
jgi:hypothetical protein